MAIEELAKLEGTHKFMDHAVFMDQLMSSQASDSAGITPYENESTPFSDTVQFVFKYTAFKVNGSAHNT
jgi:hypothetical protein